MLSILIIAAIIALACTIMVMAHFLKHETIVVEDTITSVYRNVAGQTSILGVVDGRRCGLLVQHSGLVETNHPVWLELLQKAYKDV